MSLEYISNATDELVSFLGAKEGAPLEELRGLLLSGKMRECIKGIAHYLGLPIEINLTYGDRFESQHLVTTDSSGRGTAAITAQVSIPTNMPLYGTTALQGFLFNVEVSPNCRDYPETFIAVMAHELSHVLLRSLWHKEKNNEFYTDLTAMILGFSEITRVGRKVVKTTGNVVHTTTYGYLSDEQFNLAYTKITGILSQYENSKRETLQELRTCQRQLSTLKETLATFNKSRGYFTSKHYTSLEREGFYVNKCDEPHEALV